ncbi:unnamed protein product [Urochloa decumbens]|uniref:DUF3615 domain-containing protein n=1 Tax=Urochloa decumbens TaxID=240449 RepID=A0ABC8VDW0_9POAL
MAAAGGGGRGGPASDEPPSPVQYHMSDDEDDKAFYARADRPPSPTSPGYGRPTVPAEDARAADDGDDDLFFFDDDMAMDAAAAGYSPSSDDDDCYMCEYEDDPPDPAGARRQAERYAAYALEHYNADPSNGVKPRGGGAGKERLFFAELHRQLGRDTMVPTCLRSLDSEDDRVGGLHGEPTWEDHAGGPDEARYCFACHDALKHPKDGTCYTAGH